MSDIKGIEELQKKLDKIAAIDLTNAVGKAIDHVQAAAIFNCQGFRYPTGELQSRILTDVQTKGNNAIGICYTNSDHAAYVEFGTGPVGQENHAGISPEVHPVYHQTGWIIPANAMTESQAENYGLGVLKRADGTIVGYATNGQPARPYLYPALHDHREECIDIIKKEVLKQL